MNAERLQDSEAMEPAADSGALAPPVPAAALVPVPESARQLLLRMFADPYVLGECERAELVAQLRESRGQNPTESSEFDLDQQAEAERVMGGASMVLRCSDARGLRAVPRSALWRVAP